jgi:hypothetical protein
MNQRSPSASTGVFFNTIGDYLNSVFSFGQAILTIVNAVVSLLLISILFATIYKVLPDKNIEWRDVVVGAIVTSFLFTAGKSLIGWYIGSSAVASAYGAAGALIVMLLWVYYSAQIVLLGAEFSLKRISTALSLTMLPGLSCFTSRYPRLVSSAPVIGSTVHTNGLRHANFSMVASK